MEKIGQKDKQRLRELAKRQQEAAHLPVMNERKKCWYAHNRGEANRPLVVVEMNTFASEMSENLHCEASLSRMVERQMLDHMVSHMLIDDDKVVPDVCKIPIPTFYRPFNREWNMRHAKDAKGRSIGYTWEPFITDLQTLDIDALAHAEYDADVSLAQEWEAQIRDVIGDVLEVIVYNDALRWGLSPSVQIVRAMGFENMMMALAECPERLDTLYRFVTDDIDRWLSDWEAKGFFTRNSGNDYAGAGSYGFSDELSKSARACDGPVRTDELWGNFNSQETVSVSPESFRRWIFPHYQRLAARFGLVYYGCCEPIHAYWDDALEHVGNLRKCSISPWTDQQKMADAFRDKKKAGQTVIFSRKPSPEYLGSVLSFDEKAFAEHIQQTLKAAEGLPIEFVYRDVYTIGNDKQRPKRAVQIMRAQIAHAFF